MNINDLTIGQAKELAALFSENGGSTEGLNAMVGKKVIIRTYSAGVWFGLVSQKSGKEVIISNARRLLLWKAKESISLSAVAVFGINQDESRIAPTVSNVWMEAIELLPCSQESIKSIEGAKDEPAR